MELHLCKRGTFSKTGEGKYFGVNPEWNRIDVPMEGGRDFLLWGEPGPLCFLGLRGGGVVCVIFSANCEAVSFQSRRVSRKLRSRALIQKLGPFASTRVPGLKARSLMTADSSA